MTKRRGNPNWGKPAMRMPGAAATSFEEVALTLGLTPEAFADSAPLKEWVRRNKDHKYVPPDLLKAWGFVVNGEL